MLGLLLPLAINIVDVLIEGATSTFLMSHPMQMMVPFALVLAEQTRGCDAWEKLARVGAGAATVVLCWLCTVTAYASYRCAGHNLSTRCHRHSDPASQHRLHLHTRVLIAGLCPTSDEAQVQLPVRQGCLHKNMVFWDGRAGVLGNWKHYLYDYHGVWIGEVDTDEYYDIIDGEAFKRCRSTRPKARWKI